MPWEMSWGALPERAFGLNFIVHSTVTSAHSLLCRDELARGKYVT